MSENNIKKLTLGDIYDFKYGEGNTIPTVGGDYPVYGSNGIVGSHNKWNSEDAPVIGHIGAYAGIVNWGYGKHFVTYNGVICKLKRDDILPEYAYNLLLLQDFGSMAKNGSQPFVSYEVLKSPEVLVPSLYDQKKVIDNLKKFQKLSQNIKKELELRKKQYNYYSNKLLNSSENIVKLGSIASFSQGIQVDVKEQYPDQSDDMVPFLRIVDFVKNDEPPRYIKKPDEKYIKQENTDLIMIRYGANAAGKVFLNKYGAIANNMFKINPTVKDINIRYLWHFLSQEKIYNYLNKSSKGSTMPAINFGKVSNLDISFPSEKEQEKIVIILDKLYKLIKNTARELELRRKQYEYYRNKLLSFEELSVSE